MIKHLAVDTSIRSIPKSSYRCIHRVSVIHIRVFTTEYKRLEIIYFSFNFQIISYESRKLYVTG